MANTKKKAKNILYGFQRNTNGISISNKKDTPKRSNGATFKVKKK